MGSSAASGKPPNGNVDWNDVRFFLAVAREGTLARAASALKVDQTTVGRRIAALEKRLGVAIFTRGASGLEPTTAGRRILEAAERMNEAALDLSAGLVEDGGPYAGTVHVATTESLAEHFLLRAVRDLRARHPRISVALRTGWSRVDLRRGDADIAVRLVRPDDPRMVCRKLGAFALRLYASKAYLARHGVPAALRDHALVGYEDAMRSGGSVFTSLDVEGGAVAVQANSGRVVVAAALAGLGITQLPSYVGDAEPELTPVLPEHDRPYAVWLVVPQARRNVATVRAVSDAIVAAFRRPPPATADRAAE
jgi:DNA-binding transcriptional LysR family regulator